MDYRAEFRRRLEGFSRPVQLAILACIGIAIALLLFWLFNQVVYYLIAQSYVEEIADAFDLNEHLAQALVWLSFGAIVFLMGQFLSFNRRRRIAASVGILALFVAHSMIVWYGVKDSNFTKDGQAARCYVLARDTIKTLNRTGVDPETGRECRPITPQMAEKIREYQRGKRPTRITRADPEFFDPLSGEPVVWHSKSESGAIEIFDLMGFHPQTGEELLPITRTIADAWRTQNNKTIRRAAALVSNPETYVFFDPMNGSPRGWYFLSEKGEYEFYDGPGYHPRTGEALKQVTREVLAAWKEAMDAVAAQKRRAEEDRQRLLRERTEQEAQEKKEREDREQAARFAEAEAARQLREASDNCDRLAANPTDARRAGEGVPYDVLRLQADQAVDACNKAAQQFPNELRFQYQLGRAYSFKDRKRAFEIFTSLARARYPAAFDNLGNMYLTDRSDKAAAIQYFKNGVALDDADSMVSLAVMIERGDVPTNDPVMIRVALFKRAAELGHKNAERAYQIEIEKAQRAQIEYENQQRINSQMMNVIGGIIGGAIRR